LEVNSRLPSYWPEVSSRYLTETMCRPPAISEDLKGEELVDGYWRLFPFYG